MTAISLSGITNNFQPAALRSAAEGARAFMDIYTLIKNESVGEISKSEAFRRSSTYADAANPSQAASLNIVRAELGLQ